MSLYPDSNIFGYRLLFRMRQYETLRSEYLPDCTILPNNGLKNSLIPLRDGQSSDRSLAV